MYEIEKGIPAPQITTGPRANTWPFHEMNVGDSFEFDSEDRQRAAIAASKHQRRMARKGNTVQFSIHKVSDTRHRCWRVA